MRLITRSIRLAFAFPKGLFAHRPPVWGITIGMRFMYFASPASWTTTSVRSYFSKSFISYDGRFRGFFGSFFGFSAGGGSASPVPSTAGSEGPSVAGDGSGGGAASAGGGLSGSGGGVSGSTRLPHRLLFRAADELVQRDPVHLDHLVPHARDVPVRSAHAASDPFDHDLVVFVDEVDCAVPDREGGDLPAVLDELDLHALPKRGVRLLRLDRNLFEDDPFPLRCPFKRVRFLLEVLHPPLVVAVRPTVGLSLLFQLPRSEQSPCQDAPSMERGVLTCM